MNASNTGAEQFKTQTVNTLLFHNLMKMKIKLPITKNTSTNILVY